MKKNRTELLAEKDSNLKAARDIAEKAENEGRDFTDDERPIVTGHVEKAREAHQAILELDGDASLLDSINALGLPSGELAKGSPYPTAAGKTLGERFTEDEVVTEWLKSVAPNGEIPRGARVHGPAVGFNMADVMGEAWGRKTVVSGSVATSAGALVNTEWLGLLDGLAQFQRPLTIVDVISKGTTGSDAIEYARVTGFTNNAAAVPEAVGNSSGTGGGGTVAGTKPESAMTLEKVSTTVKTIAHWLPATKRALSDAAQIRTLIDSFLRYGLAEELEDQIMSGDDTGENFEGILEVSGTQAQAFDTDILVTSRKARTNVRLNGRAMPTAYLLHPSDNERFDLLKDDEGRYYFGGPSALGSNQPLWGLPRIESEAVPEGTGMVGDWRTCVLWDREQASIQVSDSHADFFVRNLVAILAEMRAAFGVIRPPAICTFDLEAGS